LHKILPTVKIQPIHRNKYIIISLYFSGISAAAINFNYPLTAHKIHVTIISNENFAAVAMFIQDFANKKTIKGGEYEVYKAECKKILLV